MGVLGLRKFLDGLSCSKYAKPPSSRNSSDYPIDESHPMMSTSVVPDAHHVLFDLNSLIHSCLNSLPSVEDCGGAVGAAIQHSNAQRKKTLIAIVQDYVLEILTEVVRCTKTLTICIDGPAPIAKVRTQRLRRRRVSSMSLGGSGQFCDLAITAGSPFLVQLENELAAFLQKNIPNKSLDKSSGAGYAVDYHNSIGTPGQVRVLINGSTCPGEGENKISQMLAYISSNPKTCGRYCPNDDVVIIGNDIDLALTCFGATQYHNVYTFSPSTLQVFCVGEIIYRWLLKGTGFVTDANLISSVRIDLIFIFALNGGDHFAGIGDAGSDIWRRYKMIRASSPERCLVRPDLCSIDTHLLYDILQCDAYTGNAETKPGFQILVCALWSTFTNVTGICPDYRFSIPDDLNPTISHLKAATSTRKTVSLHYKDQSLPLSPLANLAALMPTIETLPKGLQTCLFSTSKVTCAATAGTGKRASAQISKKDIAERLQGNDTSLVVNAAEALVKQALAEGTLSESERYRTEFTTPVILSSVSEPPESSEIAKICKSMSRHMPDHIREKKEAQVAILRSQMSTQACVTRVDRITDLPRNYDYTAPYPCKELSFSRLFTYSLPEGELGMRIIPVSQRAARAEGYDGGEHNMYKVEQQKREEKMERKRAVKRREKLKLLKKKKEKQMSTKATISKDVKKKSDSGNSTDEGKEGKRKKKAARIEKLA